jgi:hypothetical protein
VSKRGVLIIEHSVVKYFPKVNGRLTFRLKGAGRMEPADELVDVIVHFVKR